MLAKHTELVEAEKTATSFYRQNCIVFFAYLRFK